MIGLKNYHLKGTKMSKERYMLIEKAKNLIPMDEIHKSYLLWLFLALRSVDCDLKLAVQIIQSNLKEKDIKLNYEDIYCAVEEGATIGPENVEFMRSIQILPKDLSIKIIKDEKINFSSNLGHLLWLETFINRSKPFESFLNAASDKYVTKIWSEVKRELIDHPNIG